MGDMNTFVPTKEQIIEANKRFKARQLKGKSKGYNKYIIGLINSYKSLLPSL